MKRRLLIVGTLGAVALLGAGATIAWAATGGSGTPKKPGKASTSWMHSAAQMRQHMQAVHPSLSKTQIDELVAECQAAGTSMMDDGGMMGDAGMMGGHGSHHAGSAGGAMHGGMMG